MESYSRKTCLASGADVNIHPMKPHESEGVANLIHEVYWDAYPWKYVYDSAKFHEKSPRDRIVTIVATSVEGRVVGYAAIHADPGYPAIGQLDTLVVSPRFLDRGLAGTIARHLVTSRDTGGFRSLAAGVFTSHPGTLWPFQDQGFHTSAIQFDSPSEEESFEVMMGLQRAVPVAKILTAVLVTEDFCPQYLPDHHRQIILEICAELGITVLPGTGGRMGNEPTGIEQAFNGRTMTGLVWIRNVGPDHREALTATVRQLRDQGAKIIRLHLDLSDPGSSDVVSAAEESGFVFTGIVPGKNGLILLLQTMPVFPVSFVQVRMGSPFGERLLAYIRSRSP